MQAEIHTDLALEARESFPGDGGEIAGVVLEEGEGAAGVRVTRVVIKNEKGAAAMKKPVGTYLTLDGSNLTTGEGLAGQALADALAEALEELLKPVKKGHKQPWSVLVVGLGNAAMTADALGPMAVEQVQITRNMGYEAMAYCVSSLTPSVMGRTGMETAEILRGVVKETAPDCLIVIDALAARSVTRLGTTIQLTDTGIQPGSGIGNERGSLNRQTLQVPVIAIGVPTVVSASAIVWDTLGSMAGMLSEEEQAQLFQEISQSRFGTLFVTPKDVDETVETLSRILAEGINRALTQA